MATFAGPSRHGHYAVYAGWSHGNIRRAPRNAPPPAPRLWTVQHPRLCDTRPRSFCLTTGSSPLTGLPLHRHPGAFAFHGRLPARRLHDQAAQSDIHDLLPTTHHVTHHARPAPQVPQSSNISAPGSKFALPRIHPGQHCMVCAPTSVLDDLQLSPPPAPHLPHHGGGRCGGMSDIHASTTHALALSASLPGPHH